MPATTGTPAHLVWGLVYVSFVTLARHRKGRDVSTDTLAMTRVGRGRVTPHIYVCDT